MRQPFCFLYIFFLGMVLITASFTMLQPPSIVLQALSLSDLFSWIYLSSPLYHHMEFQFSCSVMSDSLWPHGLQHARLPCPSPTPGVCSNSCPPSWWCHPTISSCCPLLLLPPIPPSNRVFSMSPLFTWGGQSIGVSATASVLPMNTQDWSLLGWTVWISLQSKGLSKVFFNTTVPRHPFFGAQLSL